MQPASDEPNDVTVCPCSVRELQGVEMEAGRRGGTKAQQTGEMEGKEEEVRCDRTSSRLGGRSGGVEVGARAGLAAVGIPAVGCSDGGNHVISDISSLSCLPFS